MVVDKKRRLLQAERRNNKGDVIDLGAPRLAAPSFPNYAENVSGDRISHSKVDPIFKDLLGELENSINSEGSPSRARKCRQPSRRRTPLLYTPNPRLYQTAPSPASVNKRAKQSANSPNSVNKRHKHKTRKYQPNPRLYKAPPNRPRVHQLPPLQPHTGWLPAPDSAPQHTASQIALQFSQRQRELLPAALNGPIIKPYDSQLPANPTPRDEIWEMVAAQPAKKSSSPEKPKSPRKSPRDKSQKNKSAKPKKASAKERPEGHVHFLPEEGSSLGLPRYSQNIPNLDDIPHLGHAESSVPNYVHAPVKQRYRPRSQHFRLRTLDSNSDSSSLPPAARLPNSSTPQTKLREVDMAASPHSSNTPEDGSDGNDSLSSAPSEYLAEFLSAIMSRNYAEALKYCRLILHYEPHNTTARGFYPLLRYKLGLSQSPLSNIPPTDGKVLGSSNSEGSSSGDGAVARSGASPEGVDDLEKGSDSEAESVASLSTDSSRKSSRSASPAERDTESSASECSPQILGVTDVTAIGASWLADDNGNPRSESNKHNRYTEEDEDDENDNGLSDHMLKETKLRQLRAQFACSIK